MSLMGSAEALKGIPLPWLRTIQIVQIQKAQLMGVEFYIEAIEGLETLMVDEIPERPGLRSAVWDKNKGRALLVYDLPEGKNPPEYWLALDSVVTELASKRDNWSADLGLYRTYCREKYRQLIKLIVKGQSKRLQGSIKREHNKTDDAEKVAYGTERRPSA